MQYPDFITLPYIQEYAAQHGEDASDQYPSALPRHFIEAYTKPKQRVFDPFMGFGTSAFVAEDLGRVPYGVEADGERFEWSAGQLEGWQNIICGDAAEIGTYDFPMMDFCITSPPFIPMHEKWNPLYGGDPEYAGYDAYLARMAEIFAAVKGVMKHNALIVVHVDNIAHKKSFTPLVRDMSLAVSRSFKPQADVIIKWEDAPDGYALTHCLVFKNA